MTKVNVRRGVRVIKPTMASMFGQTYVNVHIQVNTTFDPAAYNRMIQKLTCARTNGKNHMGWDDGETTEEPGSSEGPAEAGLDVAEGLRDPEKVGRSDDGD